MIWNPKIIKLETEARYADGKIILVNSATEMNLDGTITSHKESVNGYLGYEGRKMSKKEARKIMR